MDVQLKPVVDQVEQSHIGGGLSPIEEETKISAETELNYITERPKHKTKKPRKEPVSSALSV